MQTAAMIVVDNAQAATAYDENRVTDTSMKRGYSATTTIIKARLPMDR
jgi:hypothetical protein